MPKQVLVIQGGGAGAHAIDADLAASLARLPGGEFEVRYPLARSITKPWSSRTRLAAQSSCGCSPRLKALGLLHRSTPKATRSSSRLAAALRGGSRVARRNVYTTTWSRRTSSSIISSATATVTSSCVSRWAAIQTVHRGVRRDVPGHSLRRSPSDTVHSRQLM